MIIKYIDLCCGIGGFRVGIMEYQLKQHKYNFECVYSADIKEDALHTYNLNFNENHKPNDIYLLSPLNIPKFNLLCAGFPCFVKGTKVLTNVGYKNIEDVVLTDKLLTHTGKYQNILNLQQKIYNSDIYELKIKYHSDIIICTKEHPFYVREKKKIWNNSIRKYETSFNTPKWITAEKLTDNHYYGMVINTNKNIPEFTFDKKVNKNITDKVTIKLDKKEHWFLMGYFIGDGWIEDTTKSDRRLCHTIKFTINNKDEKEVVEIISKVLSITDKNCNTGKCKKFGCNDFIWYNIFKQFGKYAHNKIIPEWIQDAPIEFIQEFINGYMKADGCINKNKRLQITTVSYNLAYGLQRLYLKLGHIFSINKCIRPKSTIIEGRTVNQKDTYCIRGVLTHKRNVSSFIENNYVWYAPFSITKQQEFNIPVYNFEVENDNSYCVENIIVHNCQPFSSAGNKKGFHDNRGGMIFKILEICDYHKPSTIILENVSNLITLENGKYITEIITIFTSIGYHITYKKLNGMDFGIPQSRERVFIIGSLKRPFELTFNNINYPKVFLKDIIDNNAKYTDIDKQLASKLIQIHLHKNIYGYKLQDKRGGSKNIHSWEIGFNGVLNQEEQLLMNKIMLERRKKHWAKKKNITWMDGMPLTEEEITTFYSHSHLKLLLQKLVDTKYLKLEKCKDLKNGKRVYKEDSEYGYNICKGNLSFPISRILDPNNVSPTLTATDSHKLSVIIDNTYIRRLTTDELKSICGYPEWFNVPENVNKYDLFGNTIIPVIITEIMAILYN